MTEKIVRELVSQALNGANPQEQLRRSPAFNQDLLTYQTQALEIWNDILSAIKKTEGSFSIPFHLNESPKLYAIDALLVAEPLVADRSTVEAIAKIFSLFYLIVHYYDDHVEHREKFYSKFRFAADENNETQKGAAPFSFLLTALATLQNMIATGLPMLDSKQQLQITQALHQNLATQTRYFTTERKSHMTVAEVLEMKQHQVAGQALAFLADLIAPVAKMEKETKQNLHHGLLLLGSMTQITDDVRDLNLDKALGNANLIASSAQHYGPERGAQVIAEIYVNEKKRMESSMKQFYSAEQLAMLSALPFYPFFIDKTALRTAL